VNKKIFSLILLACVLFCTGNLIAQELNATVRLTIPKLQTTDPRVFQTLEQSISDFLNNQRWTDLTYENNERIECAIQINITEEISQKLFKADFALQVVRPVYGSDYKTSLLTHVDKDIIFSYEEYQPIEDSRNFFKDNLSAVLTYYAVLIIGLDFDSFSELGGDPYFTVAQGIINSVPPGVAEQDAGWNSLIGNKTNRYWLIENLLSPKVKPYREAMYQYHRYGLDMMHKDPIQSQQVIMRALTSTDQVRESYPTVMVTRMFVNAKSDEILEIFKGADKATKSLVVQVMRRLDVTNANKYNVLR
jgi:hypothetical protein